MPIIEVHAIAFSAHSLTPAKLGILDYVAQFYLELDVLSVHQNFDMNFGASAQILLYLRIRQISPHSSNLWHIKTAIPMEGHLMAMVI